MANDEASLTGKVRGGSEADIGKATRQLSGFESMLENRWYSHVGKHWWYTTLAQTPRDDVPKLIMRMEQDGFVVEDIMLLPGAGFRTDAILAKARLAQD